MTLLVPKGFRLSGVHCGIKSDASHEDLTLVVCSENTVAAGVYTQNQMFAAPVRLDRERTPSDNIRVVVVNSGNANACTGERGLQDAYQMARWAAEACQADEQQALVMSTGIIGEFLPMAKIDTGIEAASRQLAEDQSAFLAAARGIMTTDKSHKIASTSWSRGGDEIRLVGMCKGAGMIGPKMATMLALVLTDARLSADQAQSALAQAVDTSFNCISVEGHMSTNDTVLLLASGAANENRLDGPDLDLFQDRLTHICTELAKQIPDDGEGSSHLIEIIVRGCATRQDAHQIAATIANSALVKTGIAGADPNWGRILSAIGYAGVRVDPTAVELQLNGHLLFQQGIPVPFDAAAVSKSIRQQRETLIEVQLAEGEQQIQFWTSDLTPDYVRFNSDYHT